MFIQKTKSSFLILIVLCCLAAMGPLMVRVAVAGQELDDEHIKAIVKEVIQENPRLILDTVNQYVAEEKKKQAELKYEASFKNRMTDVISAGNPQKGPSDAPVTIIEYTDFQCPYCAKGAQTLDQILQMYPDRVRVVFKNKPLKMHEQALPAALAVQMDHLAVLGPDIHHCHGPTKMSVSSFGMAGDFGHRFAHPGHVVATVPRRHRSLQLLAL